MDLIAWDLIAWDLIAWTLLHGPHCMDLIAWTSLHGPHCMDLIAWISLHGPHHGSQLTGEVMTILGHVRAAAKKKNHIAVPLIVSRRP
jgi:hypothetical protein